MDNLKEDIGFSVIIDLAFRVGAIRNRLSSVAAFAVDLFEEAVSCLRLLVEVVDRPIVTALLTTRYLTNTRKEEAQYTQYTITGRIFGHNLTQLLGSSIYRANATSKSTYKYPAP